MKIFTGTIRGIPVFLAMGFLSGCGGNGTDNLPVDPQGNLSKPVLASLPAGPVFANPAGKALLSRVAPERMWSDSGPPEGRSIETALANGEVWRKLDRRHRFAGIVLAGDAGNARGLLDHLRRRRDWHPVHIDHATCILVRGPGKATLPDVEKIAAAFSDAPATRRAVALARAAGNALAWDPGADISALIAKIRELDPGLPDGLALEATVLAGKEKWPGALEKSDAALARSPEHPAALFVKAQALFALRRFRDASAPAQILIRLAPDNAQYLLLQAKIAHEQHDSALEIAALEKIIGQAEAVGLSVTFYRVFLGQAYSASGEPDKARIQFEKARGAGDATPGQKDFIDRALERLVPAAAVPQPK